MALVTTGLATANSRHDTRPANGSPHYISPPGYVVSGLVLLMLLSVIKCRHCYSTTGGRIATRIVALTPPMKKLLRLRIW